MREPEIQSESRPLHEATTVRPHRRRVGPKVHELGVPLSSRALKLPAIPDGQSRPAGARAVAALEHRLASGAHIPRGEELPSLRRKKTQARIDLDFRRRRSCCRRKLILAPAKHQASPLLAKVALRALVYMQASGHPNALRGRM